MKKNLSILLIAALLLTLAAGFAPAEAADVKGVTGGKNEAAIYRYLVGNMGFNNAVASGILANIYKESSFNPNATGDKGTSYGICQWHNSRWDDLKNYCNQNGYDWQTLEGQLHFMEYELNKSYPSLVRNLRSLHNTDYGAYRSAYYWCYQFERPAGYKTGNSEKRGNFARETFWPVYCGEDYERTTEWSSEYPTGVDESLIETWDEYRKQDYETMTTTEADLADWELLESGWKETASGSVSFVKSWPAGFDKNNSYYIQYNVSPVPEENTASKRTAATYKNGGWLYYHWCDGAAHADFDGAVSDKKTGACGVFHVMFANTPPDSLKKSSSGDGSYEYNEQDVCRSSRYFFPVEVTTEDYVTEEYLYTYGRWGEWSEWLDTVYTPSDTRRVEKRSRYRYIIDPTSGVDILRLAGNNRMQTAVAVSQACFETADSVVLASGNAFPDALAGGVLAYALKAPILLVRNTLDADTQAEIRRLGASRIYILGGEAAVSKSIETEAAKLAVVERVAGANRFETAVKIAEKTQNITGAAPTAVFFASSGDQSYADAISASSVASICSMPILYIYPDGKLHKASEEYLAANNIERATVLGGVNAVSESAEINLKALGIVCEERLAGSNRYDTCLDVLGRYRDVLNGEVMTVATGLDYPDALTGGVYAALNRSPLMLVGKSLTENQIAYLKSRGGDKLTVIGGEAYAVSQSVVEAVCRAMKEAQQTEN